MDHTLLLKSVLIDWGRVEPGSYLRRIPALRGLERLDLHKPVTFFVGENGSGKSTLLEAIAVACGFNPEGGTKNYNFSTYDSHSELWKAIRLSRGVGYEGWGYFLRAESFYNVATWEMGYADVAHPSERYHERSHGESFLSLAQSYFQPGGIFLLDEPEAALSPQRQLTLLAEIVRTAREGAQFLIASHSPILLGLPDAELLSFDGGNPHPCAYEETDSFRVTSAFVRNREGLLRRLLAEDDGENTE